MSVVGDPVPIKPGYCAGGVLRQSRTCRAGRPMVALQSAVTVPAGASEGDLVRVREQAETPTPRSGGVVADRFGLGQPNSQFGEA